MDTKYEVTGEISRRLVWAPFRVLAILSGLFLLRGLGSLFLRYCLAFRRKARVFIDSDSLVLDEEWWLWGQRVRTSTRHTPVNDLRALSLENRQHYLYLLVGFGSLAVGTWVGIHWFVDGLRAGYPYLALLGAGAIIVGLVIDLALYLVVPRGIGKRVLVLSIGPWLVRVSGVDADSAGLLLAHTRGRWQEAVVKGT